MSVNFPLGKVGRVTANRGFTPHWQTLVNSRFSWLLGAVTLVGVNVFRLTELGLFLFCFAGFRFVWAGAVKYFNKTKPW